MKNKYLYFAIISIISLMSVPFLSADLASAADAGCYKINSGSPTKITCPSSPPAVYDSANGSNILRPDTSKCYVYSQNLYDGDSSWGEPYVEVPCNTLSSCPQGQELRYSDNSRGAPICVSVATPTSGVFAGGAQAPRSATLEVGDTGCDPPDGQDLNKDNCAIISYIIIGINFLSAVAGIAIVASLMIAGFTYMTAQDNAGQTQKSKARIVQTLIALALFIFMYAFLNFLVPGGVLP